MTHVCFKIETYFSGTRFVQRIYFHAVLFWRTNAEHEIPFLISKTSTCTFADLALSDQDGVGSTSSHIQRVTNDGIGSSDNQNITVDTLKFSTRIVIEDCPPFYEIEEPRINQGFAS